MSVCGDTAQMSSSKWNDPNALGTPIKCKHCGFLDLVRLKKGVRLRNLICLKCGGAGFVRWTEYDQERAKLRKAVILGRK